ncbi:MAG: hypothetical protein ABEI27_13390 [Halobellus sp.]|uniref:hypothetical protein n=1 Tax=Halobellus sp. TaxID=1979212 RepID=UPI0035D4BFAD
MRPDWSSLRSAASVVAAFVIRIARRMTGAVRSLSQIAWHALRRLFRPLQSMWATASRRARVVLSGPVTAFVYGPLRVAVFGIRRDVSLLVGLLSPALALGTAWWVGSTVGYETLTAWVRGTWYGTDPSLAIFLAVAGLIALGAISAGVNSGLLPTGVLVSAPVFGAAVTRYATTVTYSWGQYAVSLPDAVGTALVVAFAFGAPIALVGFVIGCGLRRVARVLVGRAGPPSTVDNA